MKEAGEVDFFRDLCGEKLLAAKGANGFAKNAKQTDQLHFANLNRRRRDGRSGQDGP